MPFYSSGTDFFSPHARHFRKVWPSETSSVSGLPHFGHKTYCSVYFLIFSESSFEGILLNRTSKSPFISKGLARFFPRNFARWFGSRLRVEAIFAKFLMIVFEPS